MLDSMPYIELKALSECSIVLDNEERREIQSIIETLPDVNVCRLEDDAIFTQIRLAQQKISSRLASLFVNFRRNSNDYGALLVRNLPFDHNLPVTPLDGLQADPKTHMSEYALLLLMMFLGEPIAYQDEKDGFLIHNVCPIAGRENLQENAGSIFFDFHTENCFHPYKPDYLALFCLRSDHEQKVMTTTSSIRKALQLIPQADIMLLQQPLYRIRFATSFTKGDNSTTYIPPVPILTGDHTEPDLCIDFHLMEPITVEAQKAFVSIQKAMRQVAAGHVMKPGDMLVMDNRVAAHARNAFKPKYDGQDRWLQRLYVIEDFRRTRPKRAHGSHICQPVVFEYQQEMSSSN